MLEQASIEEFRQEAFWIKLERASAFRDILSRSGMDDVVARFGLAGGGLVDRRVGREPLTIYSRTQSFTEA